MDFLKVFQRQSQCFVTWLLQVLQKESLAHHLNCKDAKTMFGLESAKRWAASFARSAHSPLLCFIHLYRIYLGKRKEKNQIYSRENSTFIWFSSFQGRLHSQFKFFSLPFSPLIFAKSRLKNIYISAMSHKGLYLNLFHVIKKTYWVWSSFQIYSSNINPEKQCKTARFHLYNSGSQALESGRFGVRDAAPDIAFSRFTQCLWDSVSFPGC